MLNLIDQINQKLPQASDAVLQKVLNVLDSVIDNEKPLESTDGKTRDHSAFLSGYVPEDEGLYDDY